MVKVKICGIQRFDDIEYINELQPDYAGFVFANSKRQIDMYKSWELIKKLNSSIKTVGVFVNEDIDKVINIASFLNLSVLQFHGDEIPEYIEKFKIYTVWKALHVKSKDDLTDINLYNTDAILLDSSANGMYGGTGQCFDWDIIKGLKANRPLIIAGGLNEYNVGMAVKELNPFAVDVSSSVEADGYKDFNKIKKFIDKARGII